MDPLSKVNHKEKHDESSSSDMDDVHRSRDHKSKDIDKKEWSSHVKDGKEKRYKDKEP